MAKAVFHRNIYSELLSWKEKWSDQYALLIQGAKGVGKTTAATAFAKQHFRSYIRIDFAHADKRVLDLFDDTFHLDYFFLCLQQFTGVRLYRHESVIILDEVELLPKARQAVKYLVADGRYCYIETGSFLSLRKHTRDILLPSEERRVNMYPMDFPEFLQAIGDTKTADTIRTLVNNKEAAGEDLHRELMEKLRLYLKVGGMPRAVEAYLASGDLQRVEEVKKDILSRYEEDFRGIDPKGRTAAIFASIPASLSGHASRYLASYADKGLRADQVWNRLPDLQSSCAVNIAWQALDPGSRMGLWKDRSRYRLYLADTGLFATLAGTDPGSTDPAAYKNAAAQMLTAKGTPLYYYTMRRGASHHLYGIDFLMTVGDQICPAVGTTGEHPSHRALDVFCDRYGRRVGEKYLICTGDYRREEDLRFLPLYRGPFL